MLTLPLGEQLCLITGNEKIYAVVGDFHLKEVDESTFKTIQYFKQNNVDIVALAHCTSDLVCNEFIKTFGKKVHILQSGSQLQL